MRDPEAGRLIEALKTSRRLQEERFTDPQEELFIAVGIILGKEDTASHTGHELIAERLRAEEGTLYEVSKLSTDELVFTVMVLHGQDPIYNSEPVNARIAARITTWAAEMRGVRASMEPLPLTVSANND
jgi:hypothetical protein